MKIKAKDFFSKEEKESIRHAVENAERETEGEIVVSLVDESDAYREALLLGTILLSALLSLVLCVLLNHGTVWFYVPVTALLFFPCLYLFKIFPHMKLAFLSHKRVNDAVRERAVYTFFQRGVHRTAQQTGVLIFISLLERKVWILADRGIHGKIGSEVWRSLTRELTAGIREGRCLAALRSVIEKCGSELARHFPERGDQKNQLSDDVIC